MNEKEKDIRLLLNRFMAGEIVVVKGVIKAYTKADGTVVNEIDKSSTLISVEGEGTVTPTPDPTPDTGDGMTSTVITNNKQGTVELVSNGYGKQDTNDESTWYTWTYDGVTYKGAKLAISNGKYGKGLQLSGNANDAAKEIRLADFFGLKPAKK